MKKTVLGVLMALLLVSASSVCAMDATEEWVARINGPGNYYDEITAMALDSSGNVYVTGYNYLNQYNYVSTTAAYDSSGNQLWLASHAGASSISATYSIAVNNGRVFVTGYTYGTRMDYVTIAYDAATGAELWASYYSGPGYSDDLAKKLIIDSAGHVCVTGYSYGSGTGKDYATIAYDPATGAELWVQRYNGGGTDQSNTIAADKAGHIYVTGYSTDTTSTWQGELAYDYLTIAYDTAGNELWASRHNGSANQYDEAIALATDSIGNVYVTGTSTSLGGAWDQATIAYDQNGNVIWESSYNAGFEIARAIAVDNNGRVYVTGTSMANPMLNWDYATIAYDASTGVELWAARYNSTYDGTMAIAIDNTGNTYVTGYSGWGPGTCGFCSTFYSDIVTIAYDSSGAEMWRMSYSGPNNYSNASNTMATDNAGNIYVAGYAYGIGTMSDMVLIKYSTTPSTPAATITYINDLVAIGAIDPVVAGSLLPKLETAQNAATAQAADGALQAFINQVNAQAGKKIDAGAAAKLIAIATALMNQ